MEYFAFQWHITENDQRVCTAISTRWEAAKFKEMNPDEMSGLKNIKTFCKKANRLPYLYLTGGDPICIEILGACFRIKSNEHPSRYWAILSPDT